MSAVLKFGPGSDEESFVKVKGLITDLFNTLQSGIGQKSRYGDELPSENLETQVTTHSFGLGRAQDEMTEDATDDGLSIVDRKG